MPRGTRRSEMKSRLTPRRLSWLGWFWGRVWFATKIAGVIAVVAGLCVWVLAEGYMVKASDYVQDKAVAASGGMGMKVADVIVEGRHYVDANTLKETIGVKPGDPLLGVDINDLHARLTSIAWVRDVQVRRALPDRLIITLTERTPIALWRDAAGGPAVIDDEGVLLARHNLAQYGQLLAVEGKGAEKEAGTLMALLKGQPDIAVRVKKAVRVSDRRWDLLMDGGTTIRLPEDDPGFALARASKAQGQEKILDRNLKAIDLRQPDRIILEGQPGEESRDLLLKESNPV